MAASAANCKNLKTNFIGDYPLCRAGEISACCALINPCGCGFNPSGFHRSAQHNFRLLQDYEDYLPNAACQSSHQ
jgi:hypothetical protein